MDFRGRSDASSHYSRGEFPARRAFMNGEDLFWVSGAHQSPVFIWHRFHGIHLVAKFGFSSRLFPQHFTQSPKSFHFVGSTDCRDWTTILRVENAGFTEENQSKTWIIPRPDRKAFRCFGLKLISTISSKYMGLMKISMWE